MVMPNTARLPVLGSSTINDQQSTINNQRENKEVDGGWLIVDGYAKCRVYFNDQQSTISNQRLTINV
jgi:hypothetical protein